MALKNETKIKVYIGLGLTAALFLLMLLMFSGENFDLLLSLFKSDFSSEAELRDRLNDFGWRGYIAIALMSTLQVVFTFLPAEPTQMLSGLTFGFPIGLACCMAGMLLGSTVIFTLQKLFGNRLRGFFLKKLHLDLDRISRSSKCVLIIFILYIMPVIPYGMICFLAAATGMRYRRYITVMLLGSLPSMCVGVALGLMAITSNWVVTLCVVAALLIFAIVLFLKRETMFSMLNRMADKNKTSSRNKVRPMNRFLLEIVYNLMRFYYYLRGIRIRTTDKVRKPEKPSIVLCNHGSFIDFIYAGTLLRKHRPNFIAARLYFYDKRLRWLLHNVGSFPKSMFALDTESTRNCLTVLKSGGMLGMMPEARLSTTGRFEDIQESTYSFIKKAGVPVYTMKFSGDYLAAPKWGNGVRRGALVEAELDILFTAEQLKSLTPEQIKEAVEDRLYYDDFAWLETRPKVRYRCKKIAEGLENILTVCPLCGKKHSLTTKNNEIFCQHCGYLTAMDSRYNFAEDFRFRNLQQWYDWQKQQMADEIANDPDFCLTSAVELRLPSTGKGLTRSAGRGVCTLSREGLKYEGTRDTETVQIHFTMEQIYRLLFGAGENFEIYNGTEILYFVPDEKRSAVDWYTASILLKDRSL